VTLFHTKQIEGNLSLPFTAIFEKSKSKTFLCRKRNYLFLLFNAKKRMSTIISTKNKIKMDAGFQGARFVNRGIGVF